MKSGGRVTIADIALECGVSVMTVSRALRNQKNVKKAVREKVLACAEKLKYRPDPALSALIRHRTQQKVHSNTGDRLVLITPEEAQFGWGRFQILIDLVDEMSTEAGRLGYRIQSVALPASGELLKPTFVKLFNKGIRGVILAPGLDISKVPPDLWEEFVVVTLEPGAHDVPFHAVRNDFFQMGECAVKAFHKLGYRRIGYVSGPMDAFAHYRALGALAASREMFDDIETSIYRVSDWSIQEPDGFSNWIKSFRPHALISISTWPYKWLKEWKPDPQIDFAQLNRPRWDISIHGVCTVPGVHGTLIIQRLHQLILDDERGVPKARAIVRVDGYWEAKR